MTTVYIPRPIRTVEDAKALPEGTVAISEYDFVRERCINRWTGGNDERLYSHADMIGWTALVPVEAKEVDAATGALYIDGRWGRLTSKEVRLLLVTSWEAIEE